MSGAPRVLAAGALLALAGCLPVRRPSVSLERGASLAPYQAFDVAPVADESGWRLPQEMMDSVRNRLAARLRAHGYLAAPGDSLRGAVARIESHLTAFASGGGVYTLEGGPGGSRCRLRSVLFDARSGRRLGELEAVEQEATSPLPVLMQCARVVADEIDRRVRRK